MTDSIAKPRCLALVTDLIFGSKIGHMGRQTGVETRIVSDPAKVSQAGQAESFDLAIIDLDIPGLVIGRVVAELRAAHPDLRIVAFLSHVRADLADAARRVEIDTVLARSAFVNQLPAIFSDLAGASRSSQ